jgi:hypothetical protein
VGGGTGAAGGGTGGADAGTGGSGGNGGTGGQTTGIRCGDEACDPATQVCVGDASPLAVSCAPSAQPGCFGGCLIAECDGAEDCVSGEVCRYGLGENDYFRCTPAGAGYGLACTTSADCPGDAPVCGDLSSADAWESVLGWRPRACGI